MKYSQETTLDIVNKYRSGVPVEELAAQLGVPDRSIIAKLASIGEYKKKEYTNKRGETPVKKEEYIDRLALLHNVSIDRLESLEKVNKSVLILLESALKSA